MNTPRRIAGLYLLFGTTWILLTDILASRFAPLFAEFWWTSVVKGLLFVVVSAGLIYHVLRRGARVQERSATDAKAMRNLLDRVFGALQDAVFFIDVGNRTISDCNQAAEELFGYSREELIGRPTRILSPENERIRDFESQGERPAQLGQVYRSEHVLQRKDGRKITTEHTVFFADEDRSTVVSVVRDISNRVAQLRELRERRELISRILDATVDGVVFLDQERRFVFVNEAASGMAGIDLQGLIGTIAVHEEWDFREVGTHRPLPLEEMPSVIALQRGDTVRDRAMLFTRRDGRTLRIVVNSVPVRDQTGRIVGTVSSYRDVTARFEEESQRRKRERQFHDLITNVSDLILELDVRGTIRYIGPSVENILAYRPSELQGTNALELVHPEDRERVRAGLVRAIRQPDDLDSIDYRSLHADGTWRFFEAVGRATTDKPTRIVVTARDVTERRESLEALRQSETQLRQAQKMEAIGRLAGGVAHDFNNLLTAILGNCDLAEDDLAAGRSGVEVPVQEIRIAAEQAARVTSQLLAFSRQQVRTPRPLSPGRVVSDTLSVLRRLLREDIHLEVDLQDDGQRVLADPVQIEQILVNLAVNARDAMPDGGTLTIETGILRLEESLVDTGFAIPPGRYYRLVVTDTGRGIDPDELERIFEPFFTTKGQGEGTGLGLATVYGIVKQSDGFVGVYSLPDQGTTFRIYLPVVDDDSPVPPVPPPHRQRSRGVTSRSATVLIVEDEEAVRSSVARILTRAGHTALEAADGRQALERLHELADRPPDLVVTDVIMPDLNGPALAERIQERFPGLPVLFMSGYTDRVISQQGILDPGIHFLAKPFTSGELLDRVDHLLQRQPGLARDRS